MSRQQSRPGKARPTKESKGKGNSADKQPTSLFEIVPGKFNENDWSVMLDNDDSQEFVWELIDEMVDNAEKIIFRNYLNRQTIPYTINEAKKAILHIIDWQFLPKDEENDDDEAIGSIVEDEEPAACKIDSWAQGYVPSVFADELKTAVTNELDEDERRESFYSPSKMDILAQLSKEASSENVKKSSSGGDGSPRSQKAKLKTSFRTPEKSAESQTKAKAVRPPLPPPAIKKTNNQFMRYDEEDEEEEENEQEKARRDARLNRTNKEQIDLKLIEDSISKAPLACQSILKTLLSRPTAMREIEIDSEGNITSITKLDPDKMHSTAKTRFALLDQNKQAGSLELGKRSRASEKSQSMTGTPSVLGSEKTRKDVIDEEGELILEPAPGVVYRVGNTTRMGPRRSICGNKQQIILDKSENFLKPIKQSDHVDEVTKLTIEKILDASEQKYVRPMHRLRPIPPIGGNSSSSTSVN